VQVGAATARADADARGATGYCRPEDLHVDRTSGEFAGGTGIRWCWTNTCAGANGEVMCAQEDQMDAKDSVPASFGRTLLANGATIAEAFVTRFVEGDSRFNAPDNLDFQPKTGNIYVIEDADFGEVFACLPDGEDRDVATDGCLSMLSVRDPDAEPTGFIFDGTGKVAYYNIQHGQQPAALLDFASNPVDGTTDDLIRITGFKIHP
jgi:secreted PhoX family phosphatase